jgi:hypothetical protein
MTGVISVNINANDGFQANRWTKNGERGLADRVYVDTPEGTKVGYYDLVKGRWMMDKSNTSVGMGILSDSTGAKISLEIVGKDDVHIGIKTVLMPHEGPIFGQGTNLAKDFMVANGDVENMSIGEFFDSCMAGGEAWLTMHRRKFN